MSSKERSLLQTRLLTDDEREKLTAALLKSQGQEVRRNKGMKKTLMPGVNVQFQKHALRKSVDDKNTLPKIGVA